MVDIKLKMNKDLPKKAYILEIEDTISILQSIHDATELGFDNFIQNDGQEIKIDSKPIGE